MKKSCLSMTLLLALVVLVGVQWRIKQQQRK